MGTRNFGLGSRDMAWAGKIALKTQSGLSFSGIATVSERWGQFCKWAQGQGIKKMESVTQETLVRYGTGLADKVRLGELSAATAQNYVSAANRVMEIARGDRLVSASPTQDCGIPKRSGIATESRAISENDHQATLIRFRRVWALCWTYSANSGCVSRNRACSTPTKLCMRPKLTARYESSTEPRADGHGPYPSPNQSGKWRHWNVQPPSKTDAQWFRTTPATSTLPGRVTGNSAITTASGTATHSPATKPSSAHPARLPPVLRMELITTGS